MDIIGKEITRNFKRNLELILLRKEIENKIDILKNEKGIYERKEEYINACTVGGVIMGYEMALEKIIKILEIEQ